MTTIIETLARSRDRVPVDMSEEKDEDDEEPIASINALSIQVGGDDDNQAASHASNGLRGGRSGETSTSAASSRPPSLRSLLGVPPVSTAAPWSLQGSNSSSNNKLSSGSLLGVPPSTSAMTAPAGVGGASGARVGGRTVETLPSEIAPSRRKVVLGPGCSALDWARLKSSIPSQGFRKIKPSELKQHKSRESCWSAFNGKVYDLTPYLRFHPGGEEELMRVAGRDGTRLFMLTHSWVNIDSMIDSCVVGVLVSESSS